MDKTDQESYDIQILINPRGFSDGHLFKPPSQQMIEYTNDHHDEGRRMFCHQESTGLLSNNGETRRKVLSLLTLQKRCLYRKRVRGLLPSCLCNFFMMMKEYVITSLRFYPVRVIIILSSGLECHNQLVGNLWLLYQGGFLISG